MSPYNFGIAGVARVYSNGSISNTGLTGTSIYNADVGVRPVINLKADTKFEASGIGTSSNPYVA